MLQYCSGIHQYVAHMVPVMVLDTLGLSVLVTWQLHFCKTAPRTFIIPHRPMRHFAWLSHRGEIIERECNSFLLQIPKPRISVDPFVFWISTMDINGVLLQVTAGDVRRWSSCTIRIFCLQTKSFGGGYISFWTDQVNDPCLPHISNYCLVSI